MMKLASFATGSNLLYQNVKRKQVGTKKKCIRRRSTTVAMQMASRTRPHVVILPGMDGSGVLLNDFTHSLQEDDATRKVVAVQYPKTKHMTFDELRDFVASEYLSSFADDDRGYLVVCQSYSAHVGFRMHDSKTPGTLRGQVFVNGFAGPPGPRVFHGRGWLFPPVVFERQPPDWVAARFLLGGDAPRMSMVQSAVADVSSDVMAARLDACLTEDAWHRWRSPYITPGSSTLFLCGTADPVVGSTEMARKMKMAREDVGWVEVLHGPHLLLQRFGGQCAEAIDEYFDTNLEE